jgi:hypothetical protein
VRQALKPAALLAALLLGACGGDDGSTPVPPPARGAADRFDDRRAFADLRAQVAIGPRPAGSAGSRREVRLIAARLREAALEPIVQRPHRNVLATIPGREPGVVLVAAHHDTKGGIPGFVGANDGASGVAVLLELARALPRPLPGPAVMLVFFDAEEPRGDRPFEDDGSRGSRQLVELARAGGGQGAPPIDEIHALYLLDLVGDCDLRIPREGNSSPELYARLRGPAFGGESAAVLDDHVPFVEAGVPAVDLIDFDYGPGPPPGAWWHAREDRLDKVCPASLAEVGRAVIGALAG